MTANTSRLTGCLYLAGISLAASLLGSALAGAIMAIPLADTLQDVPAGILVFTFYGSLAAVPLGWLLGIPMLAAARRLLPRHVVTTTLLFSIVGLLGSLALQPGGEWVVLGDIIVLFGACVGGMHPLVYSLLNGARRRSLVAALLLVGVVVPSAVYAIESTQNMIGSRDEFDARCADPRGPMAYIAQGRELARLGSEPDTQGKWSNQQPWRSLYAYRRRIPLDEDRVLIARDYAYVPSGFAGWITGGRRVEEHCLSKKSGSEAALLRRHGVGRRPTLGDLED